MYQRSQDSVGVEHIAYMTDDGWELPSLSDEKVSVFIPKHLEGYAKQLKNELIEHVNGIRRAIDLGMVEGPVAVCVIDGRRKLNAVPTLPESAEVPVDRYKRQTTTINGWQSKVIYTFTPWVPVVQEG